MKLPEHSKSFIIVIIFFLIIAWLFLGKNNGMKFFAIHQEMKELTSEMLILQKENGVLKSEINRLKNDKTYLEDVARRKYGFLKKNEVVFEFKKAKK